MHFLIFNDIFSSVNTFDKKLFLLQNLEKTWKILSGKKKSYLLVKPHFKVNIYFNGEGKFTFSNQINKMWFYSTFFYSKSLSLLRKRTLFVGEM